MKKNYNDRPIGFKHPHISLFVRFRLTFFLALLYLNNAYGGNLRLLFNLGNGIFQQRMGWAHVGHKACALYPELCIILNDEIMKTSLTLFVLMFIPQIRMWAQMIEGIYPYQILDTTIFINNDNKLIVDSIGKTIHFIPYRESEKYMFKLFRNYYKPGVSVDFDNKNEIRISISEKNEDLIEKLKRIKENFNEYHLRNFIASFSNKTKDTLLIPTKYKNVIAVLEAKSSAEVWKPIQYCIDSHYDIGGHLQLTKMAPGQTIIFSVDNNYGELKTKMRMRLLGNDTVYLSNEFEGTINPEIFILPSKLDKRVDNDSTIFLKYPIFGKIDDLDKEIDFEINFEIED
ncbi:hypothetical protein DMA11_23680 [Marinilabiliaceae bacterium JC017]|nr:hypothetical protein DMA11_23680 [Marinilabiliaceae bacterium JC017]